MDDEKKIYLAHVNYKTQTCQSMRTHIENIVNFYEEICKIDDIKNIRNITARFHDIGKLGKDNQEDFNNIVDIETRPYSHNRP